MANQSSKCFYFFTILVLFLAGQLIQVKGECTKIVGRCDAEDCSAHCNSYAKGVIVLGTSCSFLNLCTCTFDRPPPGEPTPTCVIGMGVCTNDCNYDCCNKMCQSRYPKTGSGTCILAFDQDLCMCSYNR
ncbi:defensin-like protein 183 [Vicia villosa]|uniref:defensin-like protein 183 n=1 Tax=Vicia villosa TaxID=3911 RepID=UPI00273CE01B|nr:defensin-like protein 183 [Vicia villosa]